MENSMIIRHLRSPSREPEDIPTENEDNFLPYLDELIRTANVRDLDQLTFAANGIRRQDARINAEQQIRRVLQSEARIRSVEEFLTFGEDPEDMECSGPITRYQTVCWAPGTIFRISKNFDGEAPAIDGMRQLLNSYKDLAEKSQINPIMDPVTRMQVKFPSPRESGFKCALNEMVSKKVCDLSPSRTRRGATQSIWQVTIDNPLKE